MALDEKTRRELKTNLDDLMQKKSASKIVKPEEKEKSKIDSFETIKSSYDDCCKTVKTTYNNLLTVFKSIEDIIAQTSSKNSLPDNAQNTFRIETFSVFLYFANIGGIISEEEKKFIDYVIGEKYTVEQLQLIAKTQHARFFREPMISTALMVAIDLCAGAPGITVTGTDSISRFLYRFYEISLSLLVAIDGFNENKKQNLDKFLNCQLEYINKNNTSLNRNVERGEAFPISQIDSLSKYFSDNKVEKNTTPAMVASDFSTSMKELNDLVGLRSIKTDVSNLISLVKMQRIRESKGLNPVPVSKHLVFAGNPGTGKTTVARILAQLYKEIGVLNKGQLVEVSRADLVAGYVGQTAIKTQEKINEAMGGVLFVDEAYTLAKEGTDFGQEAVDTILKEMEDHRDDFIVIVAGYTDLMEKFINSNPGLKSRFSKVFNFEDYTVPELVSIFDKMCNKYDYRITAEAHNIVADRIYEMEHNKDDNFANARDVRNYFEQIITRQATRTASMSNPSDIDITTISEEDV